MIILSPTNSKFPRINALMEEGVSFTIKYVNTYKNHLIGYSEDTINSCCEKRKMFIKRDKKHVAIKSRIGKNKSSFIFSFLSIFLRSQIITIVPTDISKKDIAIPFLKSNLPKEPEINAIETKKISNFNIPT